MCLPMLGDSIVVACVYHFVFFIIGSCETRNDFLLPITVGFDVIYRWLIMICELDSLSVWEFSCVITLLAEIELMERFSCYDV